MPVETVTWKGGVRGTLRLIDQTKLPTKYVVFPVKTVERLWHAIKRLEVRGAPAIGVAAAFGPVIAAQESKAKRLDGVRRDVLKAIDYLATSRPTAVNLFWALDRMKRLVEKSGAATVEAFKCELLDEAMAILEEDKRVCREMGRYGAMLIPDGANVLTHCNAGGLATADYGTALAAMFTAHEQGKKIHVFADETRPLLQGARLTSWELMQAGIPCTLICDNMAAQVMKEKRVDLIITGADRIASNGDAANKIGTYGLSVLAKHHKVPFYIIAPTSTFDLTLRSGDDIPIEERGSEEITHGFGRRTAPEGVVTYCPAFDVAPAAHIAAIVTEKGIIRKPTRAKIMKLLAPEAKAKG